MPMVIFVVINDWNDIDILDVCSAAVDLGSWFKDETTAREDAEEYAEDPGCKKARVFKLSVEEVKL